MAVTLGSTGITFPDATTQTTAASAAGMVLINSVTPSSSAIIDTFISSFSSTYGAYLLVGQNIAVNSSGSIMLRFASAGSPDTTNKYSSASGTGTVGDTAYTLNNNNEAAFVEGPTDLGGVSFQSWFFSPNSTNYKYVQTMSSRQSSASTWRSYMATIAYTGTATGGFRLYLNSGPLFLAQGKLYLYGVRA